MTSMTTRQSRLSRLTKQQANQDPPRAKWTNYLTKTLADLMVEQVFKGNRQKNSFSKKAWSDMCIDFHSKTGLKWDEQQLKNRYNVLRKQYSTIKLLLATDGFSWDESLGMIVATDELWNQYVKEHPDAEAIRTNGRLLYKQLCIIFSESGVELDECVPFSMEGIVGMSIDSGTLSVFAEKEISSSEEDDELSLTPQRSAQKKRNQTGAEEVVARAILDIASASKLRAAAVRQRSERFSISNCINALDVLQGIDDNFYYPALDLFDKPNAREIFMSLKVEKRLAWLMGKLTSALIPSA